MGNPLNCVAPDPGQVCKPGGPVPLTRIKTLVSMTTPRDYRYLWTFINKKKPVEWTFAPVCEICTKLTMSIEGKYLQSNLMTYVKFPVPTGSTWLLMSMLCHPESEGTSSTHDYSYVLIRGNY